jgi:hypothetical protein
MCVQRSRPVMHRWATPLSARVRGSIRRRACAFPKRADRRVRGWRSIPRPRSCCLAAVWPSSLAGPEADGSRLGSAVSSSQIRFQTSQPTRTMPSVATPQRGPPTRPGSDTRSTRCIAARRTRRSIWMLRTADGYIAAGICTRRQIRASDRPNYCTPASTAWMARQS